MVLSFPLAQATLGDTLPVASVAWMPFYQQEFTGLGSGEILTNDLAPMLWQGEVTLRAQLNTEARALAALINALGGSQEAFYLADPLGWWPRSDPRGTLTTTSPAPVILTINADRKRLSFDGLAPGLVLSRGDYFAVDYNSGRRALIQLLEGATVDGNGETPQLEVRPHLRSGITTTLSVVFAKPAAKVKIVPNSLTRQPDKANRTRLAFSVRQTLQQG